MKLADIFEQADLPPDLIPDFGVKIGKNAKLWRGESDSSGSNGASYGQGLYTTTNRKYAQQFGKVREVPRWEALPDNPMRFKTEWYWQKWLQRFDEYHGILGARERGQKWQNLDEYIRSVFPDVDGLQVGTGKEAIFVAWPVE